MLFLKQLKNLKINLAAKFSLYRLQKEILENWEKQSKITDYDSKGKIIYKKDCQAIFEAENKLEELGSKIHESAI